MTDTIEETVSTSALADSISKLDAKQSALSLACSEGGDSPTGQQFAAALILLCSARAITALERSQALLSKAESSKDSTKPNAISLALATCFPTLETVAAELHTQAETALATATFDGDSCDLIFVPGLLMDLAIKLDHASRFGHSDDPQLQASRLIVQWLSVIGCEIGDLIDGEEEKALEILGKEPRAQAAKQVALAADKGLLPKEQLVPAFMFAVSAILAALKAIQSAISESSQTILFHIF